MENMTILITATKDAGSPLFTVEGEWAVGFDDGDAGPDSADLSDGISPLGRESHTRLKLTG